jgi:hypothetical protein
MSVKIDIDLDAEGVESRINGIAGSLEALQRAADDLDIDADADFSEITDGISDAVDALDDIDFDKKLDNFANNINEAVSDLKSALDDEIEISVDGQTNDGGSTGDDPPGTGDVHVRTNDLENVVNDIVSDGTGINQGDKNEFKSRISEATGVNNRDLSILGDYDTDDLKRIAKSVEQTTQQLTSEENPHITAPREANFGPGQNFFGEEEDYSSMEWQRLQKKASEAGVYTQNAGRDTLESRLRSQSFSDGLTIQVDHDKLGKVSLQRAMRANQGETDISAPDMSGINDGSFRTPDIDLSNFDRENSDNFFGGVGSRLNSLRPTMGKYMQAMAALIPIAVALTPALLGVASAMGAVGAAGASFIGLGLIGHAESMAGAAVDAEQRIKSLKGELFDTVQPTARMFAPIQAEMFDEIPDLVRPISEELQGLTKYEDTLFAVGESLSAGLEQAVGIIVGNEDKISQLSLRFLEITQTGILQFFQFLFNEAYRSQDMLVEVGGVLMSLVVAFFNVSKAIARVLATLAPAIEAVAGLSGLLNNDLVVALLGAVSVAYLTAAAFTKLGGAALFALNAVGAFGGTSFIASMAHSLGRVYGLLTALIGQYTALSAAASSAAAAMALTGVGALVVGAGAAAGASIMSGGNTSEPSPAPGASASGGNTVVNEYNFTNYGNMDTASEQRIRTEFERMDSQGSAMDAPDPEVSSGDSTVSGSSTQE